MDGRRGLRPCVGSARQAVRLAVLLPALWSCGDKGRPTAPSVAGRVVLQVDLGGRPFLTDGAGSASPAALETARVTLRRPRGATVLDTIVTLPDTATRWQFVATVPVVAVREPLDALVEFRLGANVAATSQGQVTAAQIGPDPTPVSRLGAVGAPLGRTVPTSLAVVVDDTLRFGGDSLRIRVRALAGTEPVPAAVVLSVAGAPIRLGPSGVAILPTGRGAVWVRAAMPNGALADSLRVHYQPVPAAVLPLGGDGQVAPVRAPLAEPLAARVVGADGDGVAGVRVRFEAPAGLTIESPEALSDSAGYARTRITLGTVAQPVTVHAVVPGTALTAAFGLRAIAGPVAALTFTATPPDTVRARAPFEVRVGGRDADGNRAPLPMGTAVQLTTATAVPSLVGAPLEAVVLDGEAVFAEQRFPQAASNVVLLATASTLAPATSASITVTTGPPAAVSVHEGDAQTADTGATLPVRPAVRVVDDLGAPVPEAAVTFAVAAGGGSIADADARTSLDGVARAGAWTLGPLVGVQRLEGRIAGGLATAFEATGRVATATPPGDSTPPRDTVPPPPGDSTPPRDTLPPPGDSTPPGVAAATVVVVDGDGQRVQAGRLVPVAPTVRVQDARGYAVVGALVRFRVAAGGGTLDADSAVSGAGGLATAPGWTLGPEPGANLLSAALASGVGDTVQFTVTGLGAEATALAMVREPSGAVSGRAFNTQPVVRLVDALGSGIPTAGVRVTAELAGGTGTLGGVTQVLTDSRGIATFHLLGITGEGPHALRFRADGLTPALSATFTVAIEAAPVSVVPATYGIGVNHACALAPDGRAYCWGANASGGIGDGTVGIPRPAATLVTGAPRFVAIGVGLGHSCGLTASGAAWCWGLNQFGQLGDGSVDNRAAPVPVMGGLAFTSLSVGEEHNCGITSGGRLYCWGRNAVGQLGDGTTTDRATPQLVSGDSTFRLVDAGWFHSCAQSSAGATYCWGTNQNGELGDGTAISPRTSPVPVAGGIAFASLSAGRHTCGLTAAGALYCWGGNTFGQLGDGSTTARTSPTLIAGLPSLAAVSAGTAHTCGRTPSGQVYCWGENQGGELGDGTTTNRTLPTLVAGGLVGASVVAGSYASCAGNAAGTMHCWGRNTNGRLGDGTTANRATPTPVSGLVGISAGQDFTCAPSTSGTAFCWGANAYGQLGDGSTLNRLAPSRVSGATAFTLVVGGQGHACGLDADGRAFCWGANDAGQLGTGTTTDRTAPTAVQGAARFVALVAGERHTCGLAADGTALCWGANESGQLGDGTTDVRTTPTAVAGRYAALAAGAAHTCAVATDGSARCWGANGQGQVGDGTFQPMRLVPTLVGGSLSFASITAGIQHSCGVTTTGQAYCWGLNADGRLGDGTLSTRPLPTLVAGGYTWSHLAAGAEHTCGRLANGLGFCWGFNGSGRLGDGTETNRVVPRQVAGGLLFARLTAGVAHSCGRTTAGATYCWGANGVGQLGDGTTTPRLAPALVRGETFRLP